MPVTTVQKNKNKSLKRQHEEVTTDTEDLTVGEHLTALTKKYSAEIANHVETLVSDLRAEYHRQAAQMKEAALLQVQGIAALKFDLTMVAQTPSGSEDESFYQGREWKFSLSNGDSIPIGRSKAKKYIKSGISMPEDDVVSTTHGKIDMKNGKLFYVDLGSSNGSSLNGEEVKEISKSYEIKNGDKLVIGNNEFHIQLMDQKENVPQA